MEIMVGGKVYKDKEIKECFYNAIARYDHYNFTKALVDLVVIEKALDKVLDLDKNMKGKLKI